MTCTPSPPRTGGARPPSWRCRAAGGLLTPSAFATEARREGNTVLRARRPRPGLDAGAAAVAPLLERATRTPRARERRGAGDRRRRGTASGAACRTGPLARAPEERRGTSQGTCPTRRRRRRRRARRAGGQATLDGGPPDERASARGAAWPRRSDAVDRRRRSRGPA